jgi:hypothetical protein
MERNQREYAPTRLETEREAREEEWQDSYEQRLVEWCKDRWLDPEDIGSVLAYEEWIEEGATQ